MSFDWSGCRVLLTGDTGFKGAWLSHWLLQRGAHVFGMALSPETTPNLYQALGLEKRSESVSGDIRNRDDVARRIAEADPDVVFHLAAQSLVRLSYDEPLQTVETNVMGTANLLDALRNQCKKCAIVVVTTDKVYKNTERLEPFSEEDRLGGYDVYSASKAATELVADSFRSSFFKDSPQKIATARAGNVIGGGDWAEDRIIPDLARAFSQGSALSIRNPRSIRPWQHVLEPLHGYMMLAEGLLSGRAEFETAFNFGPNSDDVQPVSKLVTEAAKIWHGDVVLQQDALAPHEAKRLTLTSRKARTVIGWQPRWTFDTTVSRTVAWYRKYYEGKSALELVDADIAAFEEAQK